MSCEPGVRCSLTSAWTLRLIQAPKESWRALTASAGELAVAIGHLT
jgi:hypothetical protein